MRLALDLRTRLLVFVLLTICSVLTLSELGDYRSARDAAELVHDTFLLASARQIAETVREQEGVIEALIPPSALERLSNAQRDRVIYRVVAPNGEMLAGYGDMPVPPAPSSTSDPIWYDGMFRGMPIRAVAIGQPVAGHRSDVATVTVGETLNGRDAATIDLFVGTLAREALTWTIVAIVIYVGLRVGLRPLMRLRKTILDRDPRSLALLDLPELPSELKPFVTALNASIGRVSHQIEQKQRLLVDAAHQLRTPLAVLQTQAAVGLRGDDPGAKDEALAAMAATADDMARLANQLLTLARVEAADDSKVVERADLGRVVRQVLSRQGVRALEKGISLSLDAVDDEAGVIGNPTMLNELVANLVDNALNYTPVGGEVAICLINEQGCYRLRVADNGPGIPEDERPKVFERFYRIPGSAGDGSGLGLAIAAEIARTHGGGIDLSAPASRGGLVADVWLPKAPPLRAAAPITVIDPNARGGDAERGAGQAKRRNIVADQRRISSTSGCD